MVFVIIGCVGLAVLLLSLVIGDLFDLSGHFDGALGSDVFSTAALAAFAGAFGFAAWVVDSMVGPLLASIGVGVVVGVLVAWLVIRLTRALQRDPGTPSMNTSTMVGLEGTVISSIPADGYGEVRLNVNGHPIKLNARSLTPVDPGTKVWVSGVLSATAVEVRSTAIEDQPLGRELDD